METLTAMPQLSAVALGAWCVLMIAAAVADELTAMTKHQRSAQAVRLWNSNYPVGTKVILDPLKSCKYTHTTSTAWVLCDEAVISVAGECGSVSLGRVFMAENKEAKKEMSHTKEPWWLFDSISSGERIGANNRMGNPVVIAGTSYGPTICGEANAQRIVACVNALAGIASPAALPELIAAADRMQLFLADNHQNAALFLMELESLRVALAASLAKLKGGA